MCVTPVLQVFPDSVDIRPHGQAVFKVAFRPGRDGAFFAQRLAVVAHAKAQRNFRLVAEHQMLPAWAVELRATGNTFLHSNPEFSPKVRPGSKPRTTRLLTPVAICSTTAHTSRARTASSALLTCLSVPRFPCPPAGGALHSQHRLPALPPRREGPPDSPHRQPRRYARRLLLRAWRRSGRRLRRHAALCRTAGGGCRAAQGTRAGGVAVRTHGHAAARHNRERGVQRRGIQRSAGGGARLRAHAAAHLRPALIHAVLQVGGPQGATVLLHPAFASALPIPFCLAYMHIWALSALEYPLQSIRNISPEAATPVLPGRPYPHRPTCVGASSQRTVTLHNPSRVPVAFRWRLPARLQGHVSVSPASGLLRGNESASLTWTFTPAAQKVYEARAACLVLSPTPEGGGAEGGGGGGAAAANGPSSLLSLAGMELLAADWSSREDVESEGEQGDEGAVPLSLVGEGTQGAIALDPPALELGDLRVGHPVRRQLVLQNVSDGVLRYSLDVAAAPDDDPQVCWGYRVLHGCANSRRVCHLIFLGEVREGNKM